MIEEAIVAFIDILGYGNIVKDCKNDTAVINGLEELIRNTIEMFKQFKGRSIGNAQIELFRDKIIENIKVRWISDTFLVTLRPVTIPVQGNDLDYKDNVLMCMWMYFNFISMLCPRIIGKTGLILRGGISKGAHYENEFNGNLFIFSSAYNNAYDVQKKETARIIIDDSLDSYLKEMSYLDEYPGFFYEDDGKLCFDFYCLLRSDDKSKKVISDIKAGVSANIYKYGSDPNALSKLKYFAEYHNRKIRELKFNDLDIRINHCYPN